MSVQADDVALRMYALLTLASRTEEIIKLTNYVVVSCMKKKLDYKAQGLSHLIANP